MPTARRPPGSRPSTPGTPTRRRRPLVTWAYREAFFRLRRGPRTQGWTGKYKSGPMGHMPRVRRLQFGLQFEAVPGRPLKTCEACWSRLDRSGRVRPELLMRLGQAKR